MRYKRQPRFHREARVAYNRKKAAIVKAFDVALSDYLTSDTIARQMNEPTHRTKRPSEAERDHQIAALIKPSFVVERRAR